MALKSTLELERQYAANKESEQATAYAQEKPQEKNVGATIGDFGLSIVHGAAKGLEGLLDAGAGLVGWIGGLFDSDFKKNVGDFISRDLTREVGIGTALEDVRKRSYLSDSGVGSFVQDVAGGVGQMLPAVAVSLVSGGTLAPQAFGSIIASAGGGGMEEALNDGASYDRALGYGVLQSATEGALEAVTGGAGRFAAMTGKKAVASVGKTILKEAASETFEEGASALINPLSKSVYKGKSALEEYKNPEFYVDAVKQAAVGGAVGGLMASGSLGISRARAGGKASYNLAALNAEIADTNKALAAIRAESEGMGTAVNKLKKVGKFSAKAEQNYLKYQKELYDAFDKRIAEATPEQQSKYLKKVGRLPLGYAEENGRIVKTEARAVDIASYNRNAYSASLRGLEGYLEYQPVKDASRYDTIGMIKEYIEAVNEKGGAELNFVITDEIKEGKGAYDASHGVMYLKPDVEVPEVISSTFIHELTHSTEGTKSYDKYVKFLDEFLKDGELYDRLVARGDDAYIGGVEQLKKNIGNEYLKGGSIDTIEKNALVTSETVAEITSRIFSDEGAVERLVSKNRGLGARIKQWLTDKIELLKARKNDPVRYKSLKFLEKARKLFDAALRNSVGGVTGIKFSKNIDEYPYDMQTVIKNYIDYKHEELFELAEKVREHKAEFKRISLGNVSQEVADYVKNELGLNVSGYQHAISTYAVKHIETRHGVNGEQDHSMRHLEDISRIPYVLEHYDTVEFIRLKNGELDSNGQGNPLLFYSKKINGTIYVVEAVLENKHKKLWVRSAYINKRGLHRAFDVKMTPKETSENAPTSRLEGLHRHPDADINVSPEFTSKNGPTSRLSNNSISDNSEKSNKDDKKTLQFSKKFERAPKNSKGNDTAYINKKGLTYASDAVKTPDSTSETEHSSRPSKRGLRKRFDADNVPSKLTSKTVLASRLNNSISDNSEKSNIDDKKTLQFAKDFKRAPKNYKLYGIDERYFSKREARKIVLDVVADKLNIDEFSGEIDSGNLAEVAYEFYKISNSREKGGDMAAAFKAAEAVMSVSVWQNISEGWAERKDAAASTLSVLRNCLHSLDLKGIKDEIRAKGDNSLYLKWAKSEGGVAIDTVPQLLAEDGIFIEATNPADILFEIDELYRNSKKVASEQLGEAINDALTAEQRKAVQQALVKEFLLAFAERGTLTKSGREMLSLQTKIDSLTKQLKTAARYNSLIEQGVYEAKRIADIGKMQGVGAIFTENFKSIAKQLGKVAYKEGINKSSVRRIISELGNWYNAQNELIADYLDPDVLEAIEFIKRNDGLDSYTKREIDNLQASGKIQIADTLSDIDKFIDNSVKGNIQGKKLILGKISSKLGEKIASETGINLTGYNIELRADDIKHALNRHGNIEKEKSRGQVAVNARDFITAIDVITDFKTVTLGKEGTNSLVFTKTIGDEYIAVTYYADGNKSLSLKTIYKKERNLSRTTDDKLPDHNVPNDTGTVPFNNIISRNIKDNNFYDKKYLGGFASLTMPEMEAVVTALRGVRNLFNTYQKVWKNGKLVEARPIVENALIDLDKRARKVKGFFGTLREKFKDFVGLVADPLTVTRIHDGYNEDGVFTSCYNELQKGIISAQALEIELKQQLIKFVKKTKGYKKRLISETFDWNGKKIPVGVGLSLYLTARRAHAADGLRESGFGYRDASKKWVDCGTVDSVDALVAQFSQADCDFIRLAEQVLSWCKEIKRGVDMQLKGISNVTDDFYYPIRRHDSKGLSFDDNYNNVVNAAANQSFNKEIVKGAKGMLEIGNVFDVLTDHVRGVAKYAGLAIPVDTMTKVLNMKIDGKASVITTANDKFWNGSENYFKKLVADAQGIKRGEGNGKIVEKMKNGFVYATFGLNPRSWVGQYAGLAMAGVYIDPDCLLKASATVAHLKRDGELMNKYSAAAMVRDSENYVVRAQGAIDQIGKVGEVLSKPMQLVDRHMTIVMFNAARYQVEKMHKGDASYAYGTEKNATAASEILDRVLLETQSNYMVAARSELQRKSGLGYKIITLFSSDAVKMLSRMVDAVGWLTAVKRRLSEAKLSGNTAEVAKLNAELKRAKKFAVRVFSSVVVSNVAFVLLGMLINYGLLARDKDDDESYAEIFGEGMLGSLFGLVPVAREVYGFFADGYEINNFLQDGVNNALTATQKLANLIDDAANGRPIENEEIMSTFRKSMYAIGQVFGIPFKNLNNLIYGLTKRFSPAAAYKYNSLFYKGSYTKDLSRAIDAGDEKLASTVLDMMMTARGVGKASAARTEIIRLYETGNKVLPRAVGNTVTYKEESCDLSAKELKDFKEIYAESDEVVERLVESQSYAALDDDAKAKAIKYVYDYYYKKALARFFDGAQGVTAEYETLVPIDAVAAAIAYHHTLKGSDKKEKIITYINRLNLRAAQKYIIIGILGYKNLNGESTVRTYLSSLKLPSASSALSLAGY